MSERELSALGRHVARREDALLAGVEPDEAARRRLAEYVARRASEPRPRRASPLRTPLIGLALAALLVLGIVSLDWLRPALSFNVGKAAAPGKLMTWESAPPDAPLPLRFSDGTRVELEPGARARVVALGPVGADVVLESGRAHVDVVPVRGRLPGESAWRVSTGPFAIEVKGTRFDVGWDARKGELALDLFEGSVVVQGCGAGESQSLEAGQGLRASCGGERWKVAPIAALAASAAPKPAVPPVAQVPPPPESEPAPAVSARAASAPRASRSWQALARAGHAASAYRVVLGDFDALCERAAASDLWLLGDVARLNDDTERARLAYQSLRRRFPGSALAAQAAFALGRLDVASGGSEATSWFERYLAEQPSGSLAPAAHDWLLELALQSGDRARQRAVARRYLERQPAGAHAQDARRILESKSAP
jgi:transmembrane sensor